MRLRARYANADFRSSTCLGSFPLYSRGFQPLEKLTTNNQPVQNYAVLAYLHPIITDCHDI